MTSWAAAGEPNAVATTVLKASTRRRKIVRISSPQQNKVRLAQCRLRRDLREIPNRSFAAMSRIQGCSKLQLRGRPASPRRRPTCFSGRLEIMTMGLDIATSVFQVHGMSI
jgi:hypothetical protein